MTLGRRRVLIAVAMLIAGLKFLEFARWVVQPDVDPRLVGTWSGASFCGGKLTLRGNGTGVAEYPSEDGSQKVAVQWSASGDQLTLRFVHGAPTDPYSDLKLRAEACYAGLVGAPSPMSYHRFVVVDIRADELSLQALPAQPTLATSVAWQRIAR